MNAVAVALLPGVALAQSGPNGSTRSATVPPFVVQSDGGDNRLQFTFLGQIDSRVYVAGGEDRVTDTFVLRRLRPILQGRVAKHFEFLFTPDFAAGTVNIRDAYFDTRFSNAFRVRIGRAKVPMGLERLHAAAGLLFAERALPTRIAPDRDIGVHVLGDMLGGRLGYQGAVVNGGPDGAAVDTDTNDAKDLVGRVVARPWATRTSSALSGLGLAVAASVGRQGAALPSFRSSGFQVFYSYAPNVEGEGYRWRVSPQVFYYRGPFGGYGEYVHSSGRVRRDSLTADLDHVAWQVAGSWVVTGEDATERGVRPRNDFDPERHQWGAFQAVARYHEFGVDAEAITRGLAAPGASRKARAVAVGVNWYLNPFVKWVANVERTVFDSDALGARPAENVVIVRGQLSF